jgi:ParB family chromosome partitioning protein
MVKKKTMCSSAVYEPDAGIVLMKIQDLHDFKGHPFKVERNQELFELSRSISEEGILIPLIVRSNPHGDGYEIIAGHRRKEAALWAGLTEVPVIVRRLDDDQSVIAMVDSNLQREKILPSEKAFAYKMRLQAMNHQGKHKDTASDPMEPKGMVEVSVLEADISENGKVRIQKSLASSGYRSNEQLAKMVGESVSQIKRYIRLTNLIPKILEMVDREFLALRSAVELSFLTEEEQYELHAVMELEQCIPNLSQANRLKRMSQQKSLDMDAIYEILQEIKPNQKEQIKIPLDRIGKYFPADYTPAQQAELIESLLKSWARNNKKIK